MSKKTSKTPVPLETVSPTGKQEVEQHAATNAMGTDKAVKPRQAKSTEKETAQEDNPKHSHTQTGA